jgi:D-alanyl-D-alanine dipeptidase
VVLQSLINFTFLTFAASYAALASDILDSRADFISLKQVCPILVIDARYATSNNFVGERVQGYQAPIVLLEKNAAKQLCQAATQLFKQHGLTLKVFDGYRPGRAVEHFMQWASSPENNLPLKQIYYPKLERSQLIPLGYIAEKSGHSRGSTVDLTLYDPKTNRELDMGGSFDFFDEISHTENPSIPVLARKNRQLLLQIMQYAGFKNYPKEWWHFTLNQERFPNQYFDFLVK